jgi:hypothetical protein
MFYFPYDDAQCPEITCHSCGGSVFGDMIIESYSWVKGEQLCEGCIATALSDFSVRQMASMIEAGEF